MLEKELESSNLKDITSIYIGGGTPTSLNEDQFDKLLNMVSKYHKDNMSFAIEGNIDALIKEILLIDTPVVMHYQSTFRTD